VFGPGDPLVSLQALLNATGITEKKDFKGPGAPPRAQRTMKNPCKGIPANPWCVGGRPAFRIPTTPKKHYKTPKHHKLSAHHAANPYAHR
jgi:hypothetical protein